MSMDTINKGNLENKKLKIGFIGQGFVGKNQADDFERRGYETIRYSLEEPFIQNAPLIKDCDVVFIATPTPTTPQGFDYSTIEEALLKVGSGKIAVIKSTVLPGVTEALQEKNSHIIILHAPEFLSEVTAARDSAFPDRNIVGVPQKTDAHMKAAKLLLEILPSAPYNKICSSKEAELIKYGRNTMGYVRIVFVNILYELTGKLGADWAVIQEAMSADPENGPTYMNPVHKSGRGAGGHCFIKDFAALRKFSEDKLQDEDSLNVFKYIEKKNFELLRKSEKDLGLLRGVYGENPDF